MSSVRGYAALSAAAKLEPFTFDRRSLGPQDVRIRIVFCGICHSDIHQVRNEWGGSIFPMVPGHEIVGIVEEAGSSVSRYRTSDRVGVGCFVDSCRTCPPCQAGEEQYCEGGMILTYNGRDQSGAPTYGGYSSHIVVDERYVVRIPEPLPSAGAAPLLCAGITTYSPLRHWKVGKRDKLAVVGLGGLGHMAVKIGAALGAEVTVLSTSEKKRKDAKRLGAADFVVTSDSASLAKLTRRFDAMIDTVSAPHDMNACLECLKTDGTLMLVGAPDKPLSIAGFSLVLRRRRLVGSLIGGIEETQEMLDFCAKHKIPADIETIPIQQVNEAYERMLRGDVRYRFVIDMQSLR